MPGISDLLDSDMEDAPNHINENSLISSPSVLGETQVAPAKKGKKRKCVTMPKTKSRVNKLSPAQKRKPATTKSLNSKQIAIDAHMDEDDAITQVEAQAQSKPKSRGRPPSKLEALDGDEAGHINTANQEEDGMPIVVQSNHAANKSKNPAPETIRTSKAPLRKRPRPETVDDDEPKLNGESEADELEMPAARSNHSRVRPRSRVWQESTYRRRAGSASDTERGDPNLRRKLGDITRKFENIETKYRNLKDVGVVEASTNVEKLRRQCEAITEASNTLVTSLKKELAATAPLAHDSRQLRSELDAEKAETTSLRRINAELHSSLSTAQNEISALQAKLAAARKASAEPVSQTNNKTPKASNGRNVIATSTSNMESAQIAQMKLDLYSDLSGLIIRSAKRTEEGDTYDCIQTGRNGTLHFKLFIDVEEAKTASFEETEFLYTPLLDKNRDRDMIELMPQYLTEDITFARENAAKFYQRVVDTLMKRIEVESEE